MFNRRAFPLITLGAVLLAYGLSAPHILAVILGFVLFIVGLTQVEG